MYYHLYYIYIYHICLSNLSPVLRGVFPPFPPKDFRRDDWMTRAPVTPPELRQSQVLSVDLSDNEAAELGGKNGGGLIKKGYLYDFCIFMIV